MADKKPSSILPDNITLAFARRVRKKEIADVKDSHWLHRHLKALAKKYRSADLTVGSVDYFPNHTIRQINIAGSYINPDGTNCRYTHSVVPDTVNVLVAFKLVNMDLTGHRLHGKGKRKKINYALMTVKESRPAWGRPKAEGPVGGSCEGPEDAVTAARREVLEEARWDVPSEVGIFPVRSYYLAGGSTEKRTVLGIYAELRGDNPEDRAFVKSFRKRHGGLAEEYERTHARLRSFGKFLKLSDTKDRFGPDLREFVEIIAAQGDEGPRLAYQKAAKEISDSSRKRKPLFRRIRAPVLRTAIAV